MCDDELIELELVFKLFEELVGLKLVAEANVIEVLVVVEGIFYGRVKDDLVVVVAAIGI